ncbi:hypothetical protein Q2363_26805, partial [Escherichia coli]|nr:hypothetical protein [Escherichia coli]
MALNIDDVLPRPHRTGDGFIECGNGPGVPWGMGDVLEQAELAVYV